MKTLLTILAVIVLCSLSAFAQCNIEDVVDMEGGVANAAVTTAAMASSTRGYAITSGNWFVDDTGGDLTFATAGNQPLWFPSGMLCGDSTNYAAGQGSLGIKATGTGVAARHYVIANLPSQLQLSTLHAGVWFCSDLPSTDTSIPDIFDIHSTNDFVAINFDGVGTGRYFNLETGSVGTGTTIPISTGSCPAYSGHPAGADWYFAELILGASGGINDQLNVYDTTGALVGTVSHASGNTTTATTAYIGCPGNVTSSVTAGFHCYFDSWQIASTAVNFDPLCSAGTATPDQTSVQSCLTAKAGGGTVNITSGVTTWSGQVAATLTGAVTISGATSCTAGCSPGSAGASLAFTDSTNIALSVSSVPALSLTGASATNLLEIKNLTFTNTTTNSAIAGAVSITGTHGQVSYRFDHNHITNTGSSAVFLFTQGGYGLRDHILYSGTGDYSFASSGGDFSSLGYLNWQDSTNLGTNQADITEDSNFTFNSANDMVTDGYFGCKLTIRYNQITGGQGAGFTHGTDSGGYRSCVTAEIYNNAFSISNPKPAWQSRGGTSLFHDNVLGGSAQFQSIELDYYRASASDFGVTSGWGLASVGLNWTPQTQGGVTMTLNASAYQTSHTYAANAVATLSSGGPCNVQTTAGGTTGGSAPSCPAYGSTVTDSGSVVWKNVGGTTSAGPGATGFLNTDNETTCISGATCTRYLDTNGGVYPFRDQPCLVHGQVVNGCYQWNNSGAQVPASWWATDASSAIQLNRDYFSSTPGGYTPYPYPDPLQGTAAPPTCDHGSGTYGGAFSNTCSTSSTGTVILCWSTSTTPVTNGAGTGCTTGTSMANGGSTTISSTETFNIVAGTSTLPDSGETTYSYTINNAAPGTVRTGNTIRTGNTVSQ